MRAHACTISKGIRKEAFQRRVRAHTRRKSVGYLIPFCGPTYISADVKRFPRKSMPRNCVILCALRVIIALCTERDIRLCASFRRANIKLRAHFDGNARANFYRRLLPPLALLLTTSSSHCRARARDRRNSEVSLLSVMRERFSCFSARRTASLSSLSLSRRFEKSSRDMTSLIFHANCTFRRTVDMTTKRELGYYPR